MASGRRSACFAVADEHAGAVLDDGGMDLGADRTVVFIVFFMKMKNTDEHPRTWVRLIRFGASFWAWKCWSQRVS